MSANDTPHNTITISTTHHTLVTQDKAEIHVSLTVKADSAAKAQIELKKSVKKLQQAAKDSKMAAQVVSRSFQDEHERKGKGNEQRLEATGKTIGIAIATVIAYDFEALDALIEQIAKDKLGLMTSSTTSISTRLRASVEDKLTEEAIEKFTARAKLAAKSFGFKKYTLGAIVVGAVSDERRSGSGGMVMAMSGAVGSSYMADAYDNETGYVSAREERLSLSVQGTIILV